MSRGSALEKQRFSFSHSYEEVLDAADVGAVYMPLPTATHLKWVQLAAAKKKHILLEKPIALVCPPTILPNLPLILF